MKPIRLTSLLLLTLYSLPLIASQITTGSKELTQENKKEITSSLTYKNAMEAFKNKNYTKSFKLFAELNSKYPNNEDINFYYGRSAFELKNYEYAFTSYDQVLINTPNNARVRAEFARTLMMMKSYKEAKIEFQKILLLPIPREVRQNIEKFITIIDTKVQNYILNNVAIFGFGWDNNINNNTYESVTLVGNLSLENDTKKISDTNYSTVLVTNLIVPNKSNSKFTWESTGVAFGKEQNIYHDNDIFLLSTESGFGYRDQKFKNLLSLTYDHVWIGGDQTLYLYGISNNLKYKILKNHILTTNLRFKRKKMIKKEDTQKNSTLKEISFNYMLPFTNTKEKIEFFTSFVSERKDAGTRVDINKDTEKYKISYNKNFYDSYDVTLGYQLERVNYKEMSSFLPKREDNSKKIFMKISKKINKKNIISLELSDMNIDSNINVYTYKKKYMNLNYIYVF